MTGSLRKQKCRDKELSTTSPSVRGPEELSRSQVFRSPLTNVALHAARRHYRIANNRRIVRSRLKCVPNYNRMENHKAIVLRRQRSTPWFPSRGKAGAWGAGRQAGLWFHF